MKRQQDIGNLTQTDPKRQALTGKEASETATAMLPDSNLDIPTMDRQKAFDLLLQGVENVKDYAIFLLDAQGYITSWNQGAEKIKGYKKDEIIGKHFSCFYTEEDKLKQHPQHELEIAATTGRYEEEGWRIRKDGSRFWASVVITAIYDGNHHVTGFTKVTRDLTEPKLAQDKLAMVQRAIDSIADYAILLLDKNGCIMSWNQGAEKIKGYQKEEVIGKHISIFYTQEALQANHAQYELTEAIKRGRFEDEGWRVRKDGSKFWANIILTPVYNDNRELVGFSKITRDLTERKKMEEERLKAERMKILALIAPVGIMHFDTNLDLLYANDRACEIFNIPLEAMKGKGWQKALEENDVKQVVRLIERLRQNKASGKVEHKLQGKDERALWVLSQIQPEVSANGEIVGYVQSITDISEHKLLEQTEKEKVEALAKAENEQRQRALDAERARHSLIEFIDKVCHEIRNPLHGINGCVESIHDTLQVVLNYLSTKQTFNESDKAYIVKHLEKIAEYNSDIKECANHQNVVTSDVLDYSRLEAGQVLLKDDIFNPRDIISTVATMLKVEMAKKGLKISVQGPLDEVMVRGDAYRIKQVFLNLMTNAVKFTHKGGIRISYDIEAGAHGTALLTMAIQDTGVGLNQEEISRLFQRFSQANLAVTHQYGGSGLGLAISHKIVKMMGGKMDVKSEKGQGSTFSFTVTCGAVTAEEMAIAKASPEEIKREQEPSQTRINKRILIVEDNVTNQKVLQKACEGHQCQIANNGLEAINACEQNEFDLIFMDIVMPEIDGLEATQRIRAREQSLGLTCTPIIGTSGNARDEHKTQALQAGMDEYITKPFTRKKIEGLINQWAAVKKEAEVQAFRPSASQIATFGFQNTSTTGEAKSQTPSPAAGSIATLQLVKK